MQNSASSLVRARRIAASTCLCLLAALHATAQQGVPSKQPDANPKAITVAPMRLPAPSQPGGGGSLLNRKSTLLDRRSTPLAPVRPVRPPLVAPIDSGVDTGTNSGPRARNGLDRQIYGPGSEVPPGTGGPLVPYRPDRDRDRNDPRWRDRHIHDQDNGGIIVDGRIDTDRLRIRLLQNRWPWGYHAWRPSWGYGYGGYWRSRYWWNDTPEVVYSGPWYGVDPFVATGQTGGGTAAAQPPAPQQQAPLTTIELADQAWRGGETAEAVRYFRDYMDENPDDHDALRYLALALIDDRKVDQAVAIMAMAYAQSPRLASRPLDPDDLPGGDIEFRKRLNAVSIFASKVKSSSAWLTLSVLMQAEDREATAAKMLDRAKAAGLDAKVAAELEQALR